MTPTQTNILNLFNTITTFYDTISNQSILKFSIHFDYYDDIFDRQTLTDTQFTIITDSIPDNYPIYFTFDYTDSNNITIFDSESDDYIPIKTDYQQTIYSILLDFFSYYFTIDHLDPLNIYD